MKKCLKNVMLTECTFPPEALELFNLTFAGQNPFCTDNRNPGATGNDQCNGVKNLIGPTGAFLRNDKPNSINAAAGIKTGVLQAFLSVFPTTWFFFSF